MFEDLEKYLKEHLPEEFENKPEKKSFFGQIKNIIFDEYEISEDTNKLESPKIVKDESNIDESHIYDYEREIGYDGNIIESEDETPPFLKERPRSKVAKKMSSYVPNNIEDYINNNKESEFQKVLFNMIDERELTDADVYNKVHIDRRLFSKIRNEPEYHPSKETVILLGLSLELSESEMDKLMNSASYTLPKNNTYDLIIRYCFIKGIYKIITINEMLETYNCRLLNY